MELSQKIIDSFAPTRERIKKAVAQQTEHVTLEQARAQVNKVKQHKTGFSCGHCDDMPVNDDYFVDLPPEIDKLITENFEDLTL